MPRAFCLIRSAPHYRADAFRRGLEAAGYQIVPGIRRPDPDDMLVCWNRYDYAEVQAQHFERHGAAVVIAENGIIGATENAYAKQYDPAGHQLYVLSLDFHNGPGRWPVGEPGRWRQHGITVKPWREDGEHILVLPQRGFGPAAVAPPKGWLDATLARLRKLTHRPVRVRPHPGNEPAVKPLEADLDGCWCAVTWGSGAAIKALCAGIPIYSDWPMWIGFPGALPLDQIGRDVMPTDVSRETMLNRLAWCQWTVPEIASGLPFLRLMEMHEAEARAA